MKVSKINNISHYKTSEKAYLIQDNITEYDKTDTIFEDGSSFDKRLKLSIKGKNHKLKNNSLLNKKFNLQKNRIKKSIGKNIIRVYKENTLKNNFIFYFIDIKEDIANLNIEIQFENLAKRYKLDECLEEINEKFNSTDEKIHIGKLKKDIDIIIYNHKKKYLNAKNNTYKLEDEDKYLFYGLYNELSYYFNSQLSKKRRYILTYIKIKTILDKHTIYNVLKNRILNKITLYFILQGKLKYYNIKNPTTTTMNEIKSKEAIKKQLLTSLVMLGSKLKIIYDKNSNFKDIYNCNLDKLYKLSIDINLLRLNLGIYTDEIDSKEIEEIGKSIFTGIAQLRHNLLHFKSFDIIKDDKLSEKMNKNIIQKMLNRDIDKVNSTFINNLSNLMIEEYLGEKNKEYNFLIDIDLHTKYINFTYPSFSNIYKKGYNIYNSNKSDENYNIYKNFEDTRKNLYYKSFLQLVYKYNFLPNIKIEQLSDSIESVLERNKNQNEKRGKEQFKYNQICELWKRDIYKKNISEFFQEIQRQEMIKSSDKEEKTNEKFKNNYTDFIRDVYAHYFNKYYNDKLKEFKEEKTINDITFKNLDKFKNIEDNHLLLFYCLFKFLDNYELGQIQAQLKKYYAINIEEIERDNKISAFLNDLNSLIEVIKITKPIFNPHLDKNLKEKEPNTIKSLNEYINENIKGFFEDGILDKEEYSKIYFQKDNVILHKGISDFILSGRNKLFLNIFKDYKITKKDLDTYIFYNKKYIDVNANELKSLKSNISYYVKNDNNKTIIDILQNQKVTLHSELTKYKNNVPNQKIKEYINLLEDVKVYDKVRNKVTFIDLTNVAKIQYEILSRYIGFALDWERDIHFLLRGIDLKDKNKEKIEIIFEKGKVLGKLKDLPCNHKLFLKDIYYSKIYDNCNVRNNIAHMDLLREPEHNILSYITRIQKLMSYDRKKRNVVTKTIQEIFNKENIDIKYKINSKKVYDVKLESKKAQHLKNIKKESTQDSLNIPIHSQEYINLLQHYLSYNIK